MLSQNFICEQSAPIICTCHKPNFILCVSECAGSEMNTVQNMIRFAHLMRLISGFVTISVYPRALILIP